MILRHGIRTVMMKDGSGAKENGRKIVVLADDEIDACLLALHDTQHRAIFRLMVDMGLSCSEILGDEELGLRGLYIQDLNSDAMTLRVHCRFVKEDRLATRVVPLPTSCLLAVKDFLFSMSLTLHDKAKLFDISDRRVRQFLAELPEKTKLTKPVTQAVCRRTAIFRMLKAGLSPDDVRLRLGFLQEKEEALIVVAEYFLPSTKDAEAILRRTMLEAVMNDSDV